MAVSFIPFCGRNSSETNSRLLVFRSVDDILVRVKPSLHQAFSQVFNVMNLYFTYALLYNTRNK